MRTTFNIINTVLGLLCFFASSSCKKYLDRPPITSTNNDNFWDSKQSVDQAINAMHTQLRTCLTTDYQLHFVCGELTGGLFKNEANNSFLNSITSNGLYNFKYVPYYDSELFNWSRFYVLISQANLILNKVSQLPSSIFNNDEELRNNYIGQALFMRAYAYFYMTRIWGDPVYVNKTYDNADFGNIPPLPRTPEAEVLKGCIADLEKAATLLSYSGGDPSKAIYGNKGSAYALLAHIYAWKHDYAKAHESCQKVINEGGYSLETMDNYKNIWKGLSSNESIFEVVFKNQNSSNETNTNFFATFLKFPEMGPLYNKSNAWVAYNDTIDHLYTEKSIDQRYINMLTPVDASNGDEKGYLLLKYKNVEQVTTGSNTTVLLNSSLSLLRLADIYLLDAEALAMQGNSMAVNGLNIVRKRAGLNNYNGATDKTTLVTEILNERKRELIGEGQVFYDMIRTNGVTQQLINYLGYSPQRVTDKGYYWPINLSVLKSQNPLLTQNPWWLNH